MNAQAGDFYLSNEDADRIAASTGLSASEYDALARAASMEQQQRAQEVVQKDIDNKMQILANLNTAARRVYKPATAPASVPWGMAPSAGQANIPVPASERLGYATKARELQQEIQKNLSDAGMIQGPVVTGPLTPTPQAGAEQPAPAPAPASPEPKKEQQPDIFADFKKQEEFRRGYWNFALERINSAPPNVRGQAMQVAQQVYGMIAPKTPENIAVPLIDQLTGKPVEGYALIGGKVEKLEKGGLSPELSVIGYSGVAPTKEEAINFRSALSEINSGLRDLDELITLGRQGSSLSPTQRARAQNLATMIAGKFKQQIVGEGAVTENDREILKQVVRNPLQIFTLVDIPQLLEDMKSRVISSRDERASTLGLTPINQKPQGQQQQGAGPSRVKFDSKGNRVQ